MSDLAQRFSTLLGAQAVIEDPAALAPFARDYTEQASSEPALVVQPASVAEVQGIVRLARELGCSLTVRVAGSNVGGLALAPAGGVIVDLRRMNRILAVEKDEMYALVEPAVTWEQLKAHLAEQQLPLRMGYPLSPPDTSIAANCLLDGLGNLSLRYGAMADWIGGLEVVLPDGTVARTGAGAASPYWFGRGPLPDLTGLFVNFQGSTGIVTKLAFQLWPTPEHRRRLFVLLYDRNAAFAAMRALARQQICDDVGGISWPAGKMLFGQQHPGPRDPDEPDFFLYLDFTGASARELELRVQLFDEFLRGLRQRGIAAEAPLDVVDLVRLNPAFGKFAEFPTRLEFLVDHSGGGLSWVGTYGPMSQFEAYGARGVEILEQAGLPPTIVSRPMKGGHFGVMRFITLFDQAREAERSLIREINVKLVEAALEHGFLPYKTPPWAVELLRSRLDPGFIALFRTIRQALDPHGLMAPRCWPL